MRMQPPGSEPGWRLQNNMSKHRNSLERYQVTVNDSSPLRGADPRAKLALSLCASLAVMLPLGQLTVFMGAYVVFLTWARLLPPFSRQTWRLKWFLAGLFLFDWWLVSASHALLVVLRLILLAGALILLLGTTTPREFTLALERLRLPYRYAFSLALAFQSLTLLDEEWRAINEAQRARAAVRVEPAARGSARLRQIITQGRDLSALTVPAIVMTTQRAWAMTEAAYARGFDSPHRRASTNMRLTWSDWALMLGALAIILVLQWSRTR